MRKQSSEAALSSCTLCPRQCKVNRMAGQLGFCKAGNQVRLYRYGPHHGEEPPISGERGSGTLFFSHCTLACLYCQNFPFSQYGEGELYDEDALVQVLRELAESGVHNWNLVSPTPWMPQITAALDRVRDEGINLPVVYNTSGYERHETLDAYAPWIDVYLSDLRYANASTAATGSRADDYVKAARDALILMWERLGPLQCDENGVAISGVVCRLLVLPGFAEEVVENLHWISDTLGVSVPVSVMAQYQPAHRATECSPWNRQINRDEYDRVSETVESLGFETGWVQEFSGRVDDGLLGYKMPQGRFE